MNPSTTWWRTVASGRRRLSISRFLRRQAEPDRALRVPVPEFHPTEAGHTICGPGLPAGVEFLPQSPCAWPLAWSRLLSLTEKSPFRQWRRLPPWRGPKGHPSRMVTVTHVPPAHRAKIPWRCGSAVFWPLRWIISCPVPTPCWNGPES